MLRRWEPTVGNDSWSQYDRKGAAETAGELDYDGPAYHTRNDGAPVLPSFGVSYLYGSLFLLSMRSTR